MGAGRSESSCSAGGGPQMRSGTRRSKVQPSFLFVGPSRISGRERSPFRQAQDGGPASLHKSIPARSRRCPEPARQDIHDAHGAGPKQRERPRRLRKRAASLSRGNRSPAPSARRTFPKHIVEMVATGLSGALWLHGTRRRGPRNPILKAPPDTACGGRLVGGDCYLRPSLARDRLFRHRARRVVEEMKRLPGEFGRHVGRFEMAGNGSA